MKAILKDRLSKSRADFHIFERRGGKISSGVQAALLSELRQGLGIKAKLGRFTGFPVLYGFFY